MKTHHRCTRLLLLIVILASCTNDSSELLRSDVTAEVRGADLLARTIAYHDPSGAWDSFSGSVRLMTAGGNGVSGMEIIQVEKPGDLYRSVRLNGDVRVEKGVRDGNCFHSVNGNENPTPEEINQYNLHCESILMYNEHHPAHIGFPMEARVAGVEVEDTVVRTELEGEPVLALTLVGDSAEVRHPYWAGRRTLYVDPDSYALRGYKLEENALQPSGMLWLFSGELNVNGIKMPQVKRVFGLADGALLFTDVFTYVTESEMDQL